MRINYNRSINNSGPINQANNGLPGDWPQIINFRERFNYKDIENEDYLREEEDATSALLAGIFTKLTRKILMLGLDIRHGKKKRQGEYVIEAYFVPRNKYTKTEAYILLPLNIDYDLIAKKTNQSLNVDTLIREYVEDVINRTDNPSLIRLVTVLAHEFGHFLSYCHGNHDQNLARGILYMHRNQVIGKEHFTSLVFIEESVAWRYGREHLDSYGYKWWTVFDKIKINSLQAYYERLKLAEANLSVYCDLARIEDFRKSIDSSYFNKNENSAKLAK